MVPMRRAKEGPGTHTAAIIGQEGILEAKLSLFTCAKSIHFQKFMLLGKEQTQVVTVHRGGALYSQ